MTRKKAIAIRFRFERAPDPARAAIEAFAQAIRNVAGAKPWLLPLLPWGKAAVVSGAAFPAPEATQSPGEPEKRLRAIEVEGEVLVERSYDAEGRLQRCDYVDGAWATSQWNAFDQLESVCFSNHERIHWTYRADGGLESVTYPNGRRFAFDLDADGRPRRIEYPDGWQAGFDYDERGRVRKSTAGSASTRYEWGTSGALARLEYTRGVGSAAIEPGGSLELTLAPLPAVHAGRPGFSSALGLMFFAADGSLEEMRLADADRFRLEHDRTGRTQTVWSGGAQTVYHLDSDRVLHHIIHPDGSRTCFHRSARQGFVYAIRPDGVALFQYDSHGHLQKTRCTDGSYAVCRRDRHRRLKGFSTPVGKTILAFGEKDRLERLSLPSDVEVRLDYEASGRLQRLSAKGRGVGSVSSALAVPRLVWQWGAMRTAMRLEDSGEAR